MTEKQDHVDDEQARFIEYITKAGFEGCPVCKNKDGFTWPHRVNVPQKAGETPMTIATTAHLPGSTTVPGRTAQQHERESFPTQLYLLICDRCSHVMLFAKTHMLLNALRELHRAK